jgi:seryl-tRNA synthetase
MELEELDGMKFDLHASLVLSKKLSTRARKDLKIWIREAEPLLKKGCPKGKEREASRIESWKVERNKIRFHLISGRYARAHVAILRLRKFLSPRLGKNYKIGVRGISTEKFKIEYEAKRKPKEKIKLPFVRRIRWVGKLVHLTLEKLPEIAYEKNYVDKLLKRLDEKIVAQYVKGKAELTKEVRRSKRKLQRYLLREDPTPELVSRGWIREFPGQGVWIVMPPLAALIKAIQKLVIDEIAIPLGFKEVLLPRLIPLDVLQRKGTLAGIPHEHFWVCPPMKRDPNFFEEYRDWVEITGETFPQRLMRKLDKPLFGLSHGQCEPFYDIFHDEIVSLEDLPIKLYDVNGPTWRWEGGGLKGFERVNEFLRIEFVYMDEPKKVIELRDEILRRAELLLDKVLDVEYRIDATTPIYLEHAGKVAGLGRGEFVRTYDTTVILPFPTKSRPEAELEIASFHVHTDFYVKRFRCKERKGRQVWTGCVGIGPSRWAFVFLSRWGFDYKNWPKQIRKYVGKELPKVPKLVTWPKLIE